MLTLGLSRKEYGAVPEGNLSFTPPVDRPQSSVCFTSYPYLLFKEISFLVSLKFGPKIVAFTQKIRNKMMAST